MKRKRARSARQKPLPKLSPKPIRDLGGKALKSVPGSGFIIKWGPDWKGQRRQARADIAGIPLPPDLEPAIEHYAKREFLDLIDNLKIPPWMYDEDKTADDYPDWKSPELSSDDRKAIAHSLMTCVRRGFYLALLRYSDDVKAAAEAAAFQEKRLSGSHKGGDVRRREAAPKHKAIRARFRALKKTIPKKTARCARLAAEFKMSDRNVQRIVDGLD